MSDRDELLAILTDARVYVSVFHPYSAEDQSSQELLLARIDAVLPPPVSTSFDDCDDPECNLSKGHDGPHCDIPF